MKKQKSGATVSKPVGGAAPAVSELGQRLKAFRLKRMLTWQALADLLDESLSTIYKITGGGSKKPHDLTTARINARLDALGNPEAEATTAEGAADAVVSSGQRHTERSEN